MEIDELMKELKKRFMVAFADMKTDSELFKPALTRIDLEALIKVIDMYLVRFKTNKQLKPEDFYKGQIAGYEKTIKILINRLERYD